MQQSFQSPKLNRIAFCQSQTRFRTAERHDCDSEHMDDGDVL